MHILIQKVQLLFYAKVQPLFRFLAKMQTVPTGTDLFGSDLPLQGAPKPFGYQLEICKLES